MCQNRLVWQSEGNDRVRLCTNVLGIKVKIICRDRLIKS